MPSSFRNPVYDAGIALSDRLGRHANQDGWFDDLVQYWIGKDGERLYMLEMSDLGRRIVKDLIDGREEVPAAILSELESARSSPDGDPADLSPDMIETIDAELLAIRETNPELFRSVLAKLQELVPKNSSVWVYMGSSR